MRDRLHRHRGTLLPLLVGGLFVLSMGWTACRDAGEPGDTAGEETIEEDLDRAGEKIGEGLEALGDAVEEGAREVEEEVGPEVRRVAGDVAITTRIKSKLAADPEINPLRIDVDTVNGQVSLTGTVPSEDVKQEAEDLARATEGVVSVDNLLQVVGD